IQLVVRKRSVVAYDVVDLSRFFDERIFIPQHGQKSVAALFDTAQPKIRRYGCALLIDMSEVRRERRHSRFNAEMALWCGDFQVDVFLRQEVCATHARVGSLIVEHEDVSAGLDAATEHVPCAEDIFCAVDCSDIRQTSGRNYYDVRMEALH